MRKTTIAVLEHGGGYDASIGGYTAKVTNATTAEEAVGRLVMLLSHPLGLRIAHEKVTQD